MSVNSPHSPLKRRGGRTRFAWAWLAFCLGGVLLHFGLDRGQTIWKELRHILHGFGSEVSGGARNVAEEGFVTRTQLHDLAWKFQREGIIIFLVCNLGYFDFFENWASHARDLGLDQHFLAFAEDPESYQFLEKHWPGHGVRFHVPEIETQEQEVVQANGLEATTKKAMDINSEGFKLIMYRRIFYLRALLSSGLGVLLCDVDTFFLKDPFPYFRGKYDIFGVVEIKNEYNANATDTFLRMPQGSMFLCGGFLLFKGSPYGWLILDHLLLNVFRSTKRGPNQNDQTYLHWVLQDMYWKLWHFRPRVGILPQQLFPPGWLFFRNATWRKANVDRVVWVHNNWVAGKEFKVLRYRKLKLWKVSEPVQPNKYCSSSGTCDKEEGNPYSLGQPGLQPRLQARPLGSEGPGNLIASMGNRSSEQQKEEGWGKQAPRKQQANQEQESGQSQHDVGWLARARGDSGAVLDDPESAQHVLEALRWGSHSKADAALDPQGSIIFCIPLEGEMELLRNWVASLEIAGLSSHFMVVALTKALHVKYEELWPGHSILLHSHIQEQFRLSFASSQASPSELVSGLPPLQPHGHPSSSPPPALLMLGLQPLVVSALLSIAGHGTLLVYSEVDNVFVKNIMWHLSSVCSLLVATQRPVQDVDALEPEAQFHGQVEQRQLEFLHWKGPLRGCLPVSPDAVAEHEVSTKFFVFRADSWAAGVASAWEQLMEREWDDVSRSGYPTHEKAEMLMSFFGEALRNQTASGSHKWSMQGGPCRVAIVPRAAFPPDFLVFHHPQWLGAYSTQIALVRNDAGLPRSELIERYSEHGLWAA